MEWLINIACIHFGWRIGRAIEGVTRKGSWQSIKDAWHQSGEMMPKIDKRKSLWQQIMDARRLIYDEAEPQIEMTFVVNRRMYDLISGLKATLDANDNGEAILKAVHLAALASSMGGADRKITVGPSDESILPLTVFLTDPLLFHPRGA